MDPDALHKYVVDTINDFFKGNDLSTEKLADINKRLKEYFIEYQKKYNDKPENSWLANALDQDQFFYYGNYTNPNEFLGNLNAARGL